MTDHYDDESRENLGVETEPRVRRESRDKKSRKYRAIRAGAIMLLAVGGAAAIGKHQADNWNETLAKDRKNTSALIEKQRQPGQTRCLGRTLLINSDVVYRATPNSKDYHSINPFANLLAGDNKGGVVKQDQELEVKMPKWSQDKDGNPWISFRLVNKASDISTKPGPIKNSLQVANETNWVNYGQLKGKTNPEGESYITEMVLRDAPALVADLVHCEIGEDGRTTVNEKPVAYGKIYPEGHFKESVDFMKFPKTA